MEIFRYAHFHKNGTLTAKLEISVPNGITETETTEAEITAAETAEHKDAADAPGKGAGRRRQRRGKRAAGRGKKPRKAPPSSGVEEFIRRHSRRVREAFDGAVSSSADAAYERMKDGGRAYRYRPALLRAEYKTEKKDRKTTLYVSVSAALGRQIFPAYTERHRFFSLGGTEIYLGPGRG